MREKLETPMDVVWGIKHIGTVIGRSPRQTHYMLAKGEIPAKRIGGRWCIRRADLEKFFSSEESAA